MDCLHERGRAMGGQAAHGPLTVNPGDAFFILKNAPADWVQTYWADE